MRTRLITILSVVAAFLLGAATAASQTRTVRGTVTSAEDGEPVIGAYVTVEGTANLGTLTDLDGHFVLDKVPQGAKMLVVSFMGFEDAKVPVRDNVQVALKSDAEMLETAVVTGMTTTDRRLFTGSTVKLDADDAKISGMADISRSLEGRVAGVSVQNVSGTFGTAPVPSVQPRRSASAALPPSTVPPNRCGWWTVSSWKTWWKWMPRIFPPVMPTP